MRAQILPRTPRTVRPSGSARTAGSLRPPAASRTLSIYAREPGRSGGRDVGLRTILATRMGGTRTAVKIGDRPAKYRWHSYGSCIYRGPLSPPRKTTRGTYLDPEREPSQLYNSKKTRENERTGVRAFTPTAAASAPSSPHPPPLRLPPSRNAGRKRPPTRERMRRTRRELPFEKRGRGSGFEPAKALVRGLAATPTARPSTCTKRKRVCMMLKLDA